MRRLLSMLWIPLVVELINVVAHHVLRDNSEGFNWIDAVSLIVTGAVVFFSGWTVARRLNQWGPAILGALLIWVCWALAVVMLIGFESMLKVAPAGTVIQGFVFSALLSIPVVVVVSAVAAAIAKWTRPTGS